MIRFLKGFGLASGLGVEVGEMGLGGMALGVCGLSQC